MNPNLEVLPRSIKPLWLRLTLVWSVSWLLGLLAFGIVAWILASRYYDQQLEARLRIQAIAVYGLAYYNEQGKFESDLIKYEYDLLDPNTSVWFVEPGENPIFHQGSRDGRLAKSELVRIASQVVSTGEDFHYSGDDTRENPIQLLAIPTYEMTSDRPRAAIIVATNPDSVTASKWIFLAGTFLTGLLLGLIGIVVGGMLSRWSLTPLAEYMSRREQFVSAAAHELRTPLASIQAVLESAAAANEPPSESLKRLGPLVTRATGCMDDLLLYARLEGGNQPFELQPIRLDLLVEACLPESGEIDYHAAESIILGDERLLRTAIENLISNALRHASSSAAVRVEVGDKSIRIENDGDSFSPELLKKSKRKFTVAPSATGSGLGLGIVQMILMLHGGQLTLSNRLDGGAVATIELPN